MKKIFIIFAFLFITISLGSQTLTTVTEKSTPQFGFASYIQADLVFNNFDAFRSILGKYNTDVMNLSGGTYSVGLSGIYKKWVAGLSVGLSYNGDYKHDSLNIKFNTSRFGLHSGYNLLNSKRFLITPKASIQWNRYRLINSEKDKVSLEKYLSERDLDLRFNQLTGFIGLNLSYKFYYTFSYTYWTAGLCGGYIFQFNDRPWVYSTDKRLINRHKIDMKHYTFGIFFSINIE